MVSLVISLTIILLLLTSFVMSFLFIYQKKQINYFEAIETLKHDHEKDILKTQLEMQEQTFQHISREIHDNISLSLTLAKLNLNTLDWNNPNQARIQLDSSLQQISKAIGDLSDISKGMNSELITNMGLIGVLKKETQKLRELKLFEVDYSVTGNAVFMDSQKELVIFRIIQEAVNNIIKHAEATAVKLILEYNFDHISVLIADNGRGFCKDAVAQSKDKESSAGLNNMQKRAALFNGRTIIESALDAGTNIHVTIPY